MGKDNWVDTFTCGYIEILLKIKYLRSISLCLGLDQRSKDICYIQTDTEARNGGKSKVRIIQACLSNWETLSQTDKGPTGNNLEDESS